MVDLASMSPCLSLFLICVTFQFKEVHAGACVSDQEVFNLYTNRYDKVLTYQDCLWGCCSQDSQPCCSVPTSLIIGLILGGIVIAFIVTVLVCYWCVYRRRFHSIPALFRLRPSIPPTTSSHRHPEDVDSSVGYSTRTGQADVTRGHSAYQEPPPSYEEVMKSQVNLGFVSEPSSEVQVHL